MTEEYIIKCNDKFEEQRFERCSRYNWHYEEIVPIFIRSKRSPSGFTWKRSIDKGTTDPKAGGWCLDQV